MLNPTLAFLAAALGTAALMAPACTVFWENLTILQRRDRAEVTIHGTLVAKEFGTVCGRQSRLLHFQVKRAFGKAAGPGDTVTIATPPTDAACGVDYPLGTEVVVFATRSPWNCETPIDMPFTSHASWNMQAPKPSQVDSLHGTVSLSHRSPAQATGSRPGTLAKTPAFTDAAGAPCAVDGRQLAP